MDANSREEVRMEEAQGDPKGPERQEPPIEEPEPAPEPAELPPDPDSIPTPEPDPGPVPEPAPIQAEVAEEPAGALAPEEVAAEELPAGSVEDPVETESEGSQLKAVIEAVIYVADEPLSLEQIAGALQQPVERVKAILDLLVEEYSKPDRGLLVREVAGGYKMATKPEHHEAIRAFVKNLQPPLKLSLAALETLAVIAYKQPITAPEIMEVRGVQGAGVLKTLLDRKLITTAGRKNVVGKPMLYKTTREFLLQFGLKDLNELPTLKEFEELRRLAFNDEVESEGEAVSEPVPGGEAAAAAAGAGVASEQPAPEPEEPKAEEQSHG